MLTIIRGTGMLTDDLTENTVIVHGVDGRGNAASGLAADIFTRYPRAELAYRDMVGSQSPAKPFGSWSTTSGRFYSKGTPTIVNLLVQCGTTADPHVIEQATDDLLERWWRGGNDAVFRFPIIGTGYGGLSADEVIEPLLRAFAAHRERTVELWILPGQNYGQIVEQALHDSGSDRTVFDLSRYVNPERDRTRNLVPSFADLMDHRIVVSDLFDHWIDEDRYSTKPLSDAYVKHPLIDPARPDDIPRYFVITDEDGHRSVQIDRTGSAEWTKRIRSEPHFIVGFDHDGTIASVVYSSEPESPMAPLDDLIALLPNGSEDMSPLSEVTIARAREVVEAISRTGSRPTVFVTEDHDLRFYWPHYGQLTVDVDERGEVYAHLVHPNGGTYRADTHPANSPGLVGWLIPWLPPSPVAAHQLLPWLLHTTNKN